MTTQSTATISPSPSPRGGAYEYSVRRVIEDAQDVPVFEIEREDLPSMAVLFAGLTGDELQEVG